MLSEALEKVAESRGNTMIRLITRLRTTTNNAATALASATVAPAVPHLFHAGFKAGSLGVLSVPLSLASSLIMRDVHIESTRGSELFLRAECNENKSMNIPRDHGFRPVIDNELREVGAENQKIAVSLVASFGAVVSDSDVQHSKVQHN